MIKAEIKIIDTDRPDDKVYDLKPTEVREVIGAGVERTIYSFAFEYVTINTLCNIKEEQE